MSFFQEGLSKEGYMTIAKHLRYPSPPRALAYGLLMTIAGPCMSAALEPGDMLSSPLAVPADPQASYSIVTWHPDADITLVETIRTQEGKRQFTTWWVACRTSYYLRYDSGENKRDGKFRKIDPDTVEYFIAKAVCRPLPHSG